MWIEEGSKIKIFEGYSSKLPVFEIEADEDIQVDGKGENYTILLSDGAGSVFLTNEIKQVSENEYAVYGWFKDCFYIKGKKMYDSYMNMD